MHPPLVQSADVMAKVCSIGEDLNFPEPWKTTTMCGIYWKGVKIRDEKKKRRIRKMCNTGVVWVCKFEFILNHKSVTVSICGQWHQWTVTTSETTMDPKSDVPVVARRRRKAARQLRESTPDPTQRGAVTDGSQSQASDDQSGSDCRSTGRSTVDSSPRGSVNSKKSFIERAMEYGSHRNKILSRKDKKLTVMSQRSRSVPRDSEEVPSSPEIFSLLRRAKKSLSSSRYVTVRWLVTTHTIHVWNDDVGTGTFEAFDTRLYQTARWHDRGKL